jgi:hypothetical protein
MRILENTSIHALETKLKAELNSAGEHFEISAQVVLRRDGSQISMLDTRGVIFAKGGIESNSVFIMSILSFEKKATGSIERPS